MGPVPYIVIVVVINAGVALCLFMKFLAWSGGWRRLAEQFPAREPLAAADFRASWIKVGWADYNGCVQYGISAEGLQINLWPVFRFGHQALLIPWAEMRVERVFKQFGRRGNVVAVEVGQPPIARLCLPQAVFDLARSGSVAASPAA